MPEIVTRRKMGHIALTVHWTLIVCTAGLWTPFFLAARRRRTTVTYIPEGYNGPVPGQHG